MALNTMTDLPAALEKIPLAARTEKITKIIEEAKAGEYHDYKNKKYDCGKVASYNLLQEAARAHADMTVKEILLEQASKIRNGEYDEEADEEDKKRLKADALAGGFTEAQCKELFGL